jgi:hypothetical protein
MNDNQRDYQRLIDVCDTLRMELAEARAEIARLKAAGASTIAFPFSASTDPELTCIFCALPNITHEITVLGAGRRMWCGMHEPCGARHTERMSKGPTP